MERVIFQELEILLSQHEYKSLRPAFFGLHKTNDEVTVLQGVSVEDIGDIASLDEELEQSDRFLNNEG